MSCVRRRVSTRRSSSGKTISELTGHGSRRGRCVHYTVDFLAYHILLSATIRFLTHCCANHARETCKSLCSRLVPQEHTQTLSHQTHRKNGIISSATFYPEYRLESTPASTPSSSPKSRDANLPPSPIPSFPPFTPKESPRHNHDSIAIEQTSGSSAVQVVGGPSSTMVLDPTVPGFFIVPSTCDKRRRDRDREGHDHELLDPLTGSRPMKKLKQANGRAVARDARSSTDSLPELIMPTAIDVVDFIDRKGGMCYEGDIFMRFRTGESEYVRSVINEIIVHFARVDVGRDGSRWVTLTPGIASGPMGLAEP